MKFQVSVGITYICVGRNHEVIFYDNSLKVLRTVEFDGSVDRLYTHEDMFAVVVKIENSYNIIVYNGLREVQRMDSSSNVVGFGDGKVMYIKGDMLCVIDSDSVCSVVSAVPSRVSCIVSWKSSYAIMVIHPVSNGAGFSVYFLSSNDGWHILLEAVNRSPLAMIHGCMKSNGQTLLIVRACVADRRYLYKTFAITERSRTSWLKVDMALAYRPYFRSHLTKSNLLFTAAQGVIWNYILKEKKVAFCKDNFEIESLHMRGEDLIIVNKSSFSYWKESEKEYDYPLPFPCTNSGIQKDSLVIYNEEHLAALTISKKLIS